MGVFCRLFKLLLLHWGIRRFGASEAANGGAPPKTGAAGLPLLGGSVSLWRASRVIAARRGIPERLRGSGMPYDTRRRFVGHIVRVITARSSRLRAEQLGTGADRAGGPPLLPTVRQSQAGSGIRPIEEGVAAPFRRGTLRPSRLRVVRATLDSRQPRSGGLRRHYGGPLAAGTASRRPTDRHRPPLLLQSPGPVGALGGTNGRGRQRMDWPLAPAPCGSLGRYRRRVLGGQCPGAAPSLRTGARLLWLWQLPSPRAWALQLSAQPRAIGTARSSDRDLLTIRPPAQSARHIPERRIGELSRRALVRYAM